jgi:small subunit ribosomal protein S20
MATASKAKKKTVRLASGRKRARQDVKLNAANTSLRSKFRTVVKNVQKAVASGDKSKATELFKSAQSVIDSVADKGIFHKNKAARHKSRLAAKVKALALAA